MAFSDVIQHGDAKQVYCCCTGCGDRLMSLGLESQGSCYCKNCKIVMYFQTDEAGDLFANKVVSSKKSGRDAQKQSA